MVSNTKLTGRNGSDLDNSVTKTVRPFVIQRREALLEFPEDSAFHGLVVRAKLDVEIATFLQFQKLGGSEGTEETETLFRKFGDVIIDGWNLQDEGGRDVPATADGFMTLPPRICIAIIGAWAENVASVGEA